MNIFDEGFLGEKSVHGFILSHGLTSETAVREQVR